MSTLFVRLDQESDVDTPVIWHLDIERNSNLKLDYPTLLLSELSQYVQGIQDEHSEAHLHVVALIPDKDVLYLQTELPGKNISRIRRAAPFAVEPLLADDLEETHVVVGDIRRGEAVPCVCIKKATMRRYLSLLEAVQLDVCCVTTIGLLKRDIARPNPHIWIENNTITVRTQDQLAQVDIRQAAAVLGSIASNEELDLNIVVVESGEKLSGDIDSWLDEQSVLRLLANEFLPVLTQDLDLDSTFNLMAGEFAFEDASIDQTKQWIGVGNLALTALVCIGLILGIEGFWASTQSKDIRVEAASLYKRIYPDDRLVGNPATEMMKRLGVSTQSSGDFEGMLAAIAANSQGIELVNLVYKAEDNTLTATLLLNSYAQLDTFKQSLNVVGFEFAINTAEQRTGGVRANVTLVRT